MSYKFIEHTADVKFRASGTILEDAFTSAFEALKETIAGNIKIEDKVQKEIEISATDLNNLLYKFLEEFLFLLDSQDFLVSAIKNIVIDDKNFSLKATVGGDTGKNYNFTNDVKAITYNEMFVKQEKDGWVAQVVLDV